MVDFLKLNNVCLRFFRNKNLTLTNVSTKISAGENVLILGASGSGKSSFLHTISGNIPHSVNAVFSGEVVLQGVSTLDTSVVEMSRSVGMVFQDPSYGICFPQVEQNVALVLENRAVASQEIGKKVFAALEKMCVGFLQKEFVNTLSGGQLQKVSFASTLVGNPEIVLLDEPTAMLDHSGVVAVRDAYKTLSEDLEVSVLLVEHRLDDFVGDEGILGLPSRTIVLSSAGEIIADGDTFSVFKNNIAMLYEQGCWLPLEAELYAITSFWGGLTSVGVRNFLEKKVFVSAEKLCLGDVLEVSGEPVCVVKDLAVGYSFGKDDNKVLLENVGLQIFSGEIVALLGSNGCGKSTLLRVLAKLQKPLLGSVVSEPSGMVFQNPEQQFLTTKVYDEIGYGLPLGSMRDDVVQDLLRKYRLEHVKNSNPYRLSGGEKRRLSLAAMLAHKRSILFADEPSYGLDQKDTVAMVNDLLAVSSDSAILFSTHDLRFAATLATRIIVVGQGTVLLDADSFTVLQSKSLLQKAGIVLPSLLEYMLMKVNSTCQLRQALLGLHNFRSPSLVFGESV